MEASNHCRLHKIRRRSGFQWVDHVRSYHCPHEITNLKEGARCHNVVHCAPRFELRTYKLKLRCMPAEKPMALLAMASNIRHRK
jgi:hypothetical protein